MSDIAIRAQNISKRYRIGRQERYKALRDVMTDAAFVLFRKLNGNSTAGDRHTNSEHIWALRNVSFELRQGEVMGVIGYNGAGKTTLLKVLSRITEPTEGHAEVHGRVGSLLEVGTGFHPELTGRENVYLSAAILGMKQAEIKRRFDEIVAFAEVERFIDTPVKRYSTGMQMRLAFAVAAHLEPEILLVDEVLAVGDSRFQRRCLRRMEDVARGGRTVLFVSHNLQAVSSLCKRAILLRHGEIAVEGPSGRVVGQYLASESAGSAQRVWSFESAPCSEVAKLRAVRVVDRRGETRGDAHVSEPVTLQVEFWRMRRARVLSSFHVFNDQGILLFSTENFHHRSGREEYEPGLYQCYCVIPPHLLKDGIYYVTVYLSRGPYTLDVCVREAVSFRVRDDGSGHGDFMGEWAGVIHPLLRWDERLLQSVPS